MHARYISESNYTALVEAIMALKPAKSRASVTFNQIAMALGDFGNIWPEGIDREKDVPNT